MSGALNSFGSLATLVVGGRKYRYHSLKAFAETARADITRLPYSLKILLENLLRREDGVTVRKEDIDVLARWDPAAVPDREIQFMPAAGRWEKAGWLDTHESRRSAENCLRRTGSTTR